MIINISFFKTSSFTEEEISKVSQFFCEYLLNNLKEDLRRNKFSLSLDTSTIAGENIFAFRVKFVDAASDQNNSIKVL